MTAEFSLACLAAADEAVVGDVVAGDHFARVVAAGFDSRPDGYHFVDQQVSSHSEDESTVAAALAAAEAVGAELHSPS